MKIAFIGAGRLATHLAPALHRLPAGGGRTEVVEVWSRTEASARALASQVGCHASWGTPAAATRTADLYFISVADAALADVIVHLHTGRENALFVHTAGSMPLGLFAESGHGRGAVFYPMQTFSKERVVDFEPVHFFLEAAHSDDLHLLDDLAMHLTSESHIHHLDSNERRRLHLAAVFACNFVNHCCALADEVLRPAGVGFEAMLPLLDETVEKLHLLAPRVAQTGPAMRGDANVMASHLELLRDHPDIQEVYRLLSQNIQKYHHHDRL